MFFGKTKSLHKLIRFGEVMFNVVLKHSYQVYRYSHSVAKLKDKNPSRLWKEITQSELFGNFPNDDFCIRTSIWQAKLDKSISRSVGTSRELHTNI